MIFFYGLLDLWVPKTRTLFVKIETRDSCCIKLIYCKIGKLSDVKNVLVFIEFNMNSRSLGTYFCGKFLLKIKININKIKTFHINISIFSPSAVISLAINKWQTPRLLRLALPQWLQSQKQNNIEFSQYSLSPCPGPTRLIQSLSWRG